MQKLQTVNAETLLYEPLEKPSFVVDSLIPTGREFSYVPPPPVPKEQKEKVLLLPDRYSNNEQVIHYLFGRGIDLQIIRWQGRRWTKPSASRLR